ncbi:MAG: hypothetical protein AAB486_04090 [Patescibacteria group bacterium]
MLTVLPEDKPNLLRLLMLGGVVFLAVFLTVPVLSNITPHPDEHQFFLNAWSIMGGKQLQNFLHVALTEYLLTGFLLLANILTPSGVNFPQGEPSLVTYFFGRVFGLILYLATFILGAFVLQEGKSRVRVRTLIFSVLYFGSIGVFERFLRVNSDSMSVFVALNYLFLSLRFQQKNYSVARFFLLDLAFVFLGSFTNLKALYLILPVTAYNFYLRQFVNFGRDSEDESAIFRVYRVAGYIAGLALGTVVLWYLFIPKPVDPKTFWYNIKNATVRGTGYDFEYPSQSYRSWLFYLYDFFIEYLGLSQLFVIGLVLIYAGYLRGVKAKRELLSGLRKFLAFRYLNKENYYSHALPLITVLILAYYLGVSKTLVHWSRWGVPLGVLGFLLLSVLLEKVLIYISDRTKNYSIKPAMLLPSLFIIAWTLRIFLFLDLAATNYPVLGGYRQTYNDINKLLEEKDIAKADAKNKAAWFTGYTNNVGNISLEKLVDPEGSQVEYLLWPYWNIGLLYTENNVDKFTSNQRAFVDKYAESVSFRFPTILARYMHYTKYFAWHYLGVTWNPELDSLIEPQYGVVKLRPVGTPINFGYAVSDSDLSPYKSPKSLTFNYKNLPDTYIFPTCATNPDVRKVNTGEYIYPTPELSLNGIGGKTAGLNCHSLWFRVLLRGNYYIRIEGLPYDFDDSQLVYSTLPFLWDPGTKTLATAVEDTRISAEFGVATKEKSISSLKFRVYYESIPKAEEASASAKPR